MGDEETKLSSNHNQTSAAAPDETKAVEFEAADLESLKRALAEEKTRAESYLANWQRAQADFINYKRRTEQEREEHTKFATAMLIVNLLPILDDLERALAALPVHLAGLTWVEGIRLIYRKFQGVLEAQGLTQIKTNGGRFDPTVHEAVAQAEGEEGTIVEEVQKGYKLQGRVIRPSLVVVGKGTAETTPPEKSPDTGGASSGG